MPSYKDKKLVKQACHDILEVIRPGDVVNQINQAKWYEFWFNVGFWGIQAYQKSLFGKKSNWYDTHTMLYFDEWATFSVEPPKALVKPLQDYCLSYMSIYRLNIDVLPEVSAFPDEYIKIMMDAADEMIGKQYDIGQLLDIAIREILGYDQSRPLKFFDFGKKLKVCSVGARVCYEYLYQKAIKPNLAEPLQGKWLFRALKEGKWSESRYKNYNGTDVEATAPGHFANSDYFRDEFKLVARFNNGKRIE